MEGFERACGGSREKVLQSRKASTAQNMKFSGKKIIAIKSDNILPYFKANLCLYQTLPLNRRVPYFLKIADESNNEIIYLNKIKLSGIIFNLKINFLLLVFSFL